MNYKELEKLYATASKEKRRSFKMSDGWEVLTSYAELLLKQWKKENKRIRKQGMHKYFLF